MRRLLILALCTCLLLPAATEGPASPTADDGGWINANNTDNAYASDDARAVCGSFGDVAQYSSFGFSAVSGTVDGVTVDLEASKVAGDNNTYIVDLLNVGSCTTKETGVLNVSTDATETLGSGSDTWGCASLTAANVTNSAFGIQVTCDKTTGSDPTGTTYRLDHAQITVTYTVAGGNLKLQFVETQTIKLSKDNAD